MSKLKLWIKKIFQDVDQNKMCELLSFCAYSLVSISTERINNPTKESIYNFICSALDTSMHMELFGEVILFHSYWILECDVRSADFVSR